jgi:hypothetical protein
LRRCEVVAGVAGRALGTGPLLCAVDAVVEPDPVDERRDHRQVTQQEEPHEDDSSHAERAVEL